MTTGDQNTPDDLLAAAYAVDGPDANRALYAQWADTYESGFIIESKYVYHLNVAEVFAADLAERLDTKDVIVDIGCGTGLAGAAVRHHVDSAIDGLDISPEMLAQAAEKRHDGVAVYRQLIEADLTRPLAIASETYAAAISVGTFTHGHVGAEALTEIVRILRPGGRAAIGINAAHFADRGFDATLQRLADSGRITDLRLVDVPIYGGADLDDLDNVSRVATFDIL